MLQLDSHVQRRKGEALDLAVQAEGGGAVARMFPMTGWRDTT